MEEILEAEDESREKKKEERWQQKRQGRRRIEVSLVDWNGRKPPCWKEVGYNSHPPLDG